MTSFIDKLSDKLGDRYFDDLDEMLVPKLTKFVPFMTEKQLMETAEYMIMKAVDSVCNGNSMSLLLVSFKTLKNTSKDNYYLLYSFNQEVIFVAFSYLLCYSDI